MNSAIVCRDSATSIAMFASVAVLKGPSTFGDAATANLCAGQLHHPYPYSEYDANIFIDEKRQFECADFEFRH